MNESLRPRPQNIAVMLGVALPVLSIVGSIIMAYADMATDRETRKLLDMQHESAIDKLRADVDALRVDRETAEQLAAMREQLAKQGAMLEALRDEVRRLRRR